MVKDDNPLNIPFDKINETEGTLEFKITKGNLIDNSLENILFFDVEVGKSRFTLHKNKNFDFIFTHWNIKTGIRVAIVNIDEFNVDKKLFIALTWSEKENHLYVGGEGGLNLKSNKAEQKSGKIRVGKNGALYQIGNDDMEVGWYRIMENGHEVLEPTAKEIWNFTITKVNILIDGCKAKDFLFESTLIQQCLIMLVTGFDIYTKTRFAEIEKEGKKPNIENLMNGFNRKEFVKNEIESYAKSMDKSLLESILEDEKRKRINKFSKLGRL